MGSYRSSGRGIQVPLLAIANEFIRIHMFTGVHDPRCGDSILRAEPPFWKSCLRPCKTIIRDAPILPAKFLENYVGKSKEQNAGKIGGKLEKCMGTKEWQLGTFCMIKIEIL